MEEFLWEGLSYIPSRRLMSRDNLRDELLPLSQGRFNVLRYLEDEYSPYDREVSVPTQWDGFQFSSMYKIGGGESKMAGKIKLLERRGGGIDDMWKYLYLSDREYPNGPPFQLSLKQLATRMGLKAGCARPCSFDVLRSSMRQNLGANPGPTYKELGYRKKREAAALAWSVASHLFEEAKSRPIVDYLVPRYALAGRTKIREKEKNEEKQLKGEPFGRAVWMADSHEPIMCGRFVQPLLEAFHDKLDVICLGLNKFSGDPDRLTKSLEKFNCFINGDFSKFDVHVTPSLIHKAFELIRYLMDIHRERDLVDSRCLDWIESEIIETRVVLPTGRCVMVPGGLPSGSGFTSVLGSLINAIIWIETLEALQIENYSLKVSGDDCYLGINVPNPSPEGRVRQGKKIVERVTKYMELFQQELSDKTIVGAYLYAGVVQPKVPQPILDGSSAVLAAYWREQTERLGRKLTLAEKYVFLKDEPIGPAPGSTHRWSYLFHLRAPFLSHYFKKDQSKTGGGHVMMIRPLNEVVERICYPEGRVRNIDEHIDHLICALSENLGNHHVVNHVMHYYYDAYLMKKAGVFKKTDIAKKSRHPEMQKRAWYRKIDEVVDVELSDVDFSKSWQNILQSARTLHAQTFGSRYGDWTFIRLARKGRLINAGGFSAGAPIDFLTCQSLENNSAALRQLGSFGLYCNNKQETIEKHTELFINTLETGTFSRQGGSSVFLTLTNTVVREDLREGALM